LDSAGSGKKPWLGSCEYGNESSGSMKRNEFLDQLSDYQFLKKDWLSSMDLAVVFIMALYELLMQNGEDEEPVACYQGPVIHREYSPSKRTYGKQLRSWQLTQIYV
jgi:hypothetical protein